jgi:hypothetical protein
MRGAAQLQTVGSFAMPRPASRDFAFEPEQIRVMQWALEAVCVTLQLSMASDDKVTELVGEKIIELARAGERNPDRLTARVLAEFGIGMTDRCGGTKASLSTPTDGLGCCVSCTHTAGYDQTPE